MHRIYLLILFQLSFIGGIIACDCPALAPLTIVECRKFDVILQCKIDSVSSCKGKSIAYAEIIEVYKGNESSVLQFEFDCSSSCQMSFANGEQWLIYGKYNGEKKLEVAFCDRNRKQIADSQKDYFAISSGLSFDEEIRYLVKNIGLKISRVKKNKQAIDITQRENDQTSGMNKILLLFVSLILFLVIYYFVNKKIS